MNIKYRTVFNEADENPIAYNHILDEMEQQIDAIIHRVIKEK